MTEKPPMTKPAAMVLASFIHHAVRPDWDEAGILKALGDAKDRGDAATVAVAAILAAQNAANHTPGVIPLTGPHWAATGATTPRRRAPDRNQTCGTCYLAKDECRRRWFWDHEFESVAAAKARVIATADRVPKVRRIEYLDGRPIREVELP